MLRYHCSGGLGDCWELVLGFDVRGGGGGSYSVSSGRDMIAVYFLPKQIDSIMRQNINRRFWEVSKVLWMLRLACDKLVVLQKCPSIANQVELFSGDSATLSARNRQTGNFRG